LNDENPSMFPDRLPLPGFIRCIAVRSALMGAGLSCASLTAASLTWGPTGGGGSGSWDANASKHWYDGGRSVRWPAPGGTDDDAVFSGASGTVSLASGITANDLAFNSNGYIIQSHTLTLNGTTPTVITGTGVTAEISSVIGGSAGLTKAGAGALVLSGNNTFTGNVTVSGGMLHATHNGGFGSGSKTVIATVGSSAGIVLDGTSGNLTFASGIGFNLSGSTLRNVAGENIVNGQLGAAIGAGNGIIASDGGTLTFAGTVRAVNSGGRTLDFRGTSTGDNRITGQIIDGTSTLAIIKSGTGTWEIAHSNNTYTGNTNLNAGKLVLAGNLQSPALNANGGTLAPEGTPSLAGSFTLAASAIYQIRAMPSLSDRLSVGGTVTLAGSLELVVPPGTSGGGSFVILNNRGSAPISGTFAGLPEGAQFSAGGLTWQITYTGGDGNDVVLTREPGALQTFEQRRDMILEALRGKPFVQGYISPSPEYRRPESYTYMDFALRCFLNDEQIPEANAAVAAFCNQYADNQYFDNVDWMSDMVFRILEDYGSQGRIAPGKLTQANEAALFNLFWQYAKRDANLADTSATTANVWNLPNGTENLNAMNIATLWHASKVLRNHPAYAGLAYDSGVTPEAYFQAGTAYYKTWLRERAGKGMLVEFSNNGYNPVTIKCVYNLVDYAEDAELRELARKWLDLFWITWAQEQIKGVKGGGMARIYQGGQSMTGWDNPLSDIFWCYTGMGKTPTPVNNVLTYLASSYRPAAVMLDLATDIEGRGAYTNIERKMGRAINGTQDGDLNETFTRHTYVTPDYVLGTFHVGNWRYWLWQMISSQNRWHGAIFNSHPDARIFFQCGVIPSGNLNYNQHWSVQNRNAIIVQKLNNNGTESTRYAKYAGEMKVWVAAAGRADLLERAGWVFASYGSAYAAIKVVDGGFTWRNDDDPAFSGQWMVLEKEYSPVVMEVGRAGDFAGFTAFQDQILANTLTFAGSTVNYQSTLGDALTLYSDYSQSPRVNGMALNYKPTKAYDSPFVAGDFGAGVVTLQKGSRQMTLDFNTQVPATFTWTAGNDVWDTNTRNWNNGTASWPNAGGATAVFEGATANVILTPGLYPAGLTFDTQTVLSGAPLQLAGLQAPFQTATGITARIDAPVHGWAGLAKTGPGTLVLTGDNPLKGITRIDAGTLQVGDGGSYGSLGSTSIINNALLSINRSGTVTFSSLISGTGSIQIENPAATDIVVLGGNNSFTGNFTLTRGTLRLAHSSALGETPRSLSLDGSNNIVQVGGEVPVILPSSITFSASGKSLFNLSGDNRINGAIQLGEPSGAAVTSTSGSLNLAGNITGGGTARTLELTGSSTGDNLVSGLISDGTQPTSLLKSGPGTWRISGAQPYTGGTIVNDGTLVLAGSLSGAVDVTGGSFAASGTASIGGNLGIASNGTFQALPDASLDVAGTITLAGNLSVNFPRGILVGSQFTILRKTSAGPVSGTFAGLPQLQTFTAAGYSWRISYIGGDGNDVVLTSLTGPANTLEVWRDVNFGYYTNTGIAADSADPDGDGITNAQEYALGSNPNNPAEPSSFVWTQPAGGNWTTSANWNTNLAPPGNASRRLEFFAGLTLPGGTTATSNNFSGTYALNRLRLAGESPATQTVNLTGGSLDFRASGAIAPSIVVSTAAAPVNYTLANNTTLSADLAIDAMNGGQAILSGVLSGPGGITFTGTGNNLVLSGNNTYQGTTRIVSGLYPGTINAYAGTLQIGNGGSTGSPGTGPIVNDGTLAFNRTGTLQVPNQISGSGRLLLNNPSSSNTVVFSGENSFTGGITLTRGALVITRSSALGTGEKSVSATSGNARLELDGGATGITLDSNISMTLSGTELRNASGNNTVRGSIGAAIGAGGSTISSNGGSLTITGTLQTVNSGGRTITLGGTSTGANTISGRMIDGVSTLTIQKTGTGTWILTHPDNTYTGPTNITAGKLILSGNLTSPITVTTATLAPQGAPSTTGALVLNGSSRFEIRPGDTLGVGGSATLAGELDIIAPPGLASGASFTILNPAGTATGTFNGKPEAATFSASGYDWQITYSGGDGNDVVLTNITPPSAIENWRMLHFGTMANTGNAADSFDADSDGETNLLEFATGQSPHAATRAFTSVFKNPSAIEFRYTRSKEALDAGYQFEIQHADSPGADPWTGAGPGTVEIDGPVQTVSATIAPGLAGRRFIRVRVMTP
jgi:autotransporter-associated beta strand protein